jgi:hypothetical protein
MSVDDIKLSSVNWQHGMLLTPDHFLRQERYFDSALMWVLRYTTCAYGLVGGGPRLPESERGTVRHDPIVTIAQDDEALSVSVTQCRGITPAGCIVDVDSSHAIRTRFPVSDLEGLSQPLVCVVCQPHAKKTSEGPTDEFNPQMATERSPDYEIRLGVAADKAPYSLAVARLRKQSSGGGFEKDPTYIPACTTVVSYSELAAAWRRIVEVMASLTGRYTELYRAMQEALPQFKERGAEGYLDVEMMTFVGRMMVALQECTYDILDPTQAPLTFFGVLQQFFRGAAVLLEISPAAREYFATLRETGETEFIPPLERQKKILRTTRGWEVSEDLATEVGDATRSLDALVQLEKALEGKYIDFRFSPTLEAMDFFFDREGRELYKAVAAYARPAAEGEEWIFTFAKTHLLEGRTSYRLILVGQDGTRLDRGEKMHADIYTNYASTSRRAPIIRECVSQSPEQRNFEFDFDAPTDVPSISDVQVRVLQRYPVRSAMLFKRQRFYGDRPPEPRRPLVQPEKPREEIKRPPPAPSVTPKPSPSVPDDRTTFARRSQPSPERDRPRSPSPEPSKSGPSETTRKSPWDTQKRVEPREPEKPGPRKRLY